MAAGRQQGGGGGGTGRGFCWPPATWPGEEGKVIGPEQGRSRAGAGPEQGRSRDHWAEAKAAMGPATIPILDGDGARRIKLDSENGAFYRQGRVDGLGGEGRQSKPGKRAGLWNAQGEGNGERET